MSGGTCLCGRDGAPVQHAHPFAEIKKLLNLLLLDDLNVLVVLRPHVVVEFPLELSPVLAFA